MRKTLLLQIGFRKSTQCICRDYWPGENSTELSQLANNHWVQKSSVLRTNHFTDSAWKKYYWVGDKFQENRKTSRDVTADTFQSTREHCGMPDARTRSLTHIHCSTRVPLAVQPTLDTPFSLAIYPRKSRLPPNLHFTSIQPTFSIRELTWKVSPALRTGSEHSLLLLSCDLSHAWHSQEGQSHGSGPLHQNQGFRWKNLRKTLKAAFYTTWKWSHCPTSFTWVLFCSDTPVIHHSATCP